MPDEDADGTGGEEEPVAVGDAAPSAPTHEPFSFKLLGTVQSQQSLNGLRHNDHLRYRQYCARRVQRLYDALRHKHGRGRYKPAPLPADFSDMRYLEIPLANAERAWSYGMQLKADNAAASVPNPRWRHHSIQRFAKAAKWAQVLESLCKVHADQRTQMEAEAYAAFLEGVHLVEKEQWSEALAKIVRCRKVCEYLSLASSAEEAAFLKAKAQELAPLLRECKYNLGVPFDGEEEADDSSALPKAGGGAAGGAKQRDVSGLNYRGHGLAIPSEKVKGKLLRCVQLVKETAVSAEVEESAAVIEKYGLLSAEFGDVLKDIHGDMITAGADGQTDEWRTLEAFARELSTCMNVERNLVLLRNHFSKMEPFEEIASAEARRTCRPEEGMRYCDLLREDVENLRGLPDSSEAISKVLTAYVAIAINCRCFFLALCYTSVGKALEAAALLNMLQGRVDDVALEDPEEGPLARLHDLFAAIQRAMPTRVAQWRCRELARLCSTTAQRGGAPAAQPDEARGGPGAAGNQGGGGAKKDDATRAAAFPPPFRDIPCKPLLFDLAFPCIVPPDIEELALRAAAAEGQQKGFLGRVAGVAGRLGGLWGRR